MPVPCPAREQRYRQSAAGARAGVGFSGVAPPRLRHHTLASRTGSGAEMTTARLFALVLAAGGGTRFGGGKLLAPWRGRPLVAHALGAASTVCGARTLLVTGSAWREVCRACAPLPGFFVRNEDWRSGIG